MNKDENGACRSRETLYNKSSSRLVWIFGSMSSSNNNYWIGVRSFMQIGCIVFFLLLFIVEVTDAQQVVRDFVMEWDWTMKLIAIEILEENVIRCSHTFLFLFLSFEVTVMFEKIYYFWKSLKKCTITSKYFNDSKSVLMTLKML